MTATLPPAPTQTVQLCRDGHAAMLAERGELAQGHPLPKFGDVQVDAVLSKVSSAFEAASGGVYAMGDFQAVVDKSVFPGTPRKGTICQVRGEQWKIKDPVNEMTATYQFPITRFLR